jgi:hypothetical protein
MPAAVGFASVHMSLPVAMGSFAIGSYLIGFIAALCLPDATGADLTTVQGSVPEPDRSLVSAASQR